MDYHLDDFAPPEGSLVLTTTSVGNWESCKRRWYLQHALDMDAPFDKTAVTMGSVLHACAERYLLAPKGLVPEPFEVPAQPFADGAFTEGSALYGQVPGARIRLFPPQWHVHKDRDGEVREIGPEEQQTVRLLLAEGIQSGTLAHLPRGQVEHKFWLPMTEGIWLTSLIDYRSETARAIEDHKTIGDMKYAKTPHTLYHNSQQKIYAAACSLEWGLSAGEKVSVSHNVFEKKVPNRVRKVQTDMPVEHALGYLEDLSNQFKLGATLKKEQPSYLEVEPNFKACTLYGAKHACPFMALCHKPAPYETTMSSPQQFLGQPNPKCPVCGGTGHPTFGNRNSLCGLCVQKGFIAPAGDGEAEAPAPAPAPQPKPQAVQAPQAAPKLVKQTAPPVPEPEPVYEEVDDPEEEQDEPEEKPRPKRGRPPKVVEQPKPRDPNRALTVGEQLMGGEFQEALGIAQSGKEPGKRGRPAARMTLVIDCGVTSIREGRAIFHLNTLVYAMLPQWPQVFGLRFEDDENWSKRERLASAASDIATLVGDGVICADSGDYRFGPLIAALAVHADLVVRK